MKYAANNILLIATRQIGDVLLVTPLLRSLRRAYPNAVIDVLVYDNKGGMLEGNPDYNHLISIAEHPTVKEYKVLLLKIFRRYDLAISTLSGDRPLLYSLLAAAKRVSIVPPYRWQDAWKRLVTQTWVELDNQATHTLIQNLKLVDLLGIDRDYTLVIPKSPHSTERLNQLLPFAWSIQVFVVLHLLPMWHYKRWTVTGWRRLIHYFTQKGWYVVVTGGSDKKEAFYIQQVLRNQPNTVMTVAGQLGFSEVAQLIQASRLYIGPDTAVTHLAAATGVPTVALYGPTNPLKWAPWPCGYRSDKTPFQRKGIQKVGNVLLIQGSGVCVPCHQEGCNRHKQSYSRCLKELETTTVIKAIEKFFINTEY